MPPFWKLRKKKQQVDNVNGRSKLNTKSRLDKSLEFNINAIKKATGESPDIIIRDLRIANNFSNNIAIAYVDGIIDNKTLHESIIKEIINNQEIHNRISTAEIMKIINEKTLMVGDIKEVDNWDYLISQLLSGETVIMLDGCETALSVGPKGGEQRSTHEPNTEIAVRGPRDSFTESIRTNTTLIRKRIKSPNLWLETRKLGRVTQTDVSIMYLNGIVAEETVLEVRERLNTIDIDSILETGHVEQLIEDKAITLFPTIYHTERPDVVAANLLEGRIGIFIDGTPFALVVPTIFIQFFQTADDDYSRFDNAGVARFLRIISYIISLVAPALFIAMTTFHQELLPTPLAITITAQREVVPFPTFAEATLLIVFFEILFEIGLRLTRSFGKAISIIGILILGQALVQAGVATPSMVIVLSISVISSFAIPGMSLAISIRIIRYFLMLLAAIFGLYGVMIGGILVAIHLCSLRSFGVPYMTPFAPFIRQYILDMVIRTPGWLLKKRPLLINQFTGQHLYPKSEFQDNEKVTEKGDKSET